MSLRESPALTPKMLAANRPNARRSTGPTTAGGRWNASQNALQPGHYARSLRRSMLALGENAEEFDRVYRELAEQFQPASAFWNGQVEEQPHEPSGKAAGKHARREKGARADKCCW